MERLNTDTNKMSKTRLMITSMELENFKSYAGLQTIGPFHKRFSSIVGPNGSGKSNVIDALLFVFGKRAKQLRLNKVSELIHKSSNFRDLDYARVSVHFQLIEDDEEDDDAYEIVDNSQFVVSRTAYQNNQSKYTIDGKNCTYTEVGQVLRSYGIDLDNNRFLILQGEVEQIAMMKPKAATPHEEGLLEYLEDIIGSNRFVERIEETSKRLDELNEQRVEKVNRLKIAEKERDNLSGSKQEAEEFMEKEKEIRRKKNLLYQIYENVANNNSSDYSNRLEKANEKLDYEKNKLKESEARLSIIQKDYEKVNSEYTSVSNELNKSNLEYDAFERKDVKLQEDMKHHKANVKKFQLAISKESKKESESKQEAETLHIQIEKYHQTIADINSKKQEEENSLQAIMDSLRDSTEDLRRSLETSQGNLAAAEKAVAGLQTEKESVLMSINLLQSRSEQAKKELLLCSGRLEKLSMDKKSLQEKSEKVQKEMSGEIQSTIDEYEKAVQEGEQEEKQISQKLREATIRCEETKALLLSQQSAGSANGVVDKLLKATRKGGVLSTAGVLGRLGDLACIPPEYDVAISTACGHLDYLVVETAAGGQTCINFLRDNNAGRASFIALDQMTEWEKKMSNKVTPPKEAARLIDLVQLSDERLRPALYMALRDTLVATDLDSAVKIAYEGDRAVWRVVTLDGNLIDVSGAMSGGGKSARSGGMRLATSGGKAAKISNNNNDKAEEVTEEMVRKLELKVSDLRSQLDMCRSAKMSAEKEIQDLRHRLKSASTELAKLQMAVDRVVETEAEVRSRIEVLKKSVELTSAENESISLNREKLSEIEEEITRVCPNLKALKQEVGGLQRQILNVGGPKLSKIQNNVDTLVHQLESVSSSLSTKQVEESNLLKSIEKASSAREKAEQDLNKSQDKLDQLVIEQKEMEADATLVVNAVEAAKEKLSALEDTLKSSTKEYNELKAVVTNIKSVEVDLNVEVLKIKSELKEQTEIAKKWKKESENVRNEFNFELKEFQSAMSSVKSSIPAVVAKPKSVEEEEEDSDKMDTDDGENNNNNNTEEDENKLEELPIYPVDQLEECNVEEVKKDLNHVENERNKLKSSVNMSALIEYMKKDANYRCRLMELEEITEVRNGIRKEYEDLRRQRLEEFMGGFGVITLKLKEMYQMITLGGDAELELLDSLDPFSEGIVFSVRPPKKSWKNISNLSGGEKTLSSLALVFALHHFKPTPLYVMDEIDAALDFKNVSIVANYIKDRTKNAQFVIISLRNNMFELADRLVGIYKTNDATKSVTINPKMFQEATSGKLNNNNNSKTSENTKKPLGDLTNQSKLMKA